MWGSDGTRAALPLVVLALLAQSPRHGYALLGQLDELGFAGLKGSTLYPLLGRHEEAGRITHTWDHEGSGPARKIYDITDQGRRDLTDLRAQWSALDATVRAATAAPAAGAPTSVTPQAPGGP